MQNKTYYFAFVSEKEKEKQIFEIKKYYRTEFDVLPSDIIFLMESDWDRFLDEKLKEVMEYLKDKDTKAEDTMGKDNKDESILVVTDLRVFSSDPNELAGTLRDIMFERCVRVEVIKKEHRDLLELRQPGTIGLSNERRLAGLVEVCCKILKDDDK